MTLFRVNEAMQIITLRDVQQAPSFEPHSDGAELVTPTCVRMIHSLQDAIFSAYSFIELMEAGQRCDGNSVDAHGAKSLALKSKALRMLADSITKAAQAATQIAASSQQQLAGMDQVALAMENIKQASAKNVAGTNQAEIAAHTLNEIGHKLRQMVERYGVDTSPQRPARG